MRRRHMRGPGEQLLGRADLGTTPPGRSRRPPMTGSVSVAASRSVDAADYPERESGGFFASAPGKVTRTVHRVELPHICDRASRKAAWETLVRASGGVDYAVEV